MYQYPVDGKPGKGFKVTSPFGWRTHPTSGKKSHHNGVDLWANGTVYNEAFARGIVMFAGPSKSKKTDGTVGGFGFYVQILHKIDGQYYVSVYAHNEPGSLKVKRGDRVVAGTVLGKMGASGDVTGKHLHFEICKGKKYQWSADGSGFVDPMAFIKALMARDAVVRSAPHPTPEPVARPVTKAPTPVKKKGDLNA